jgi:hypothetical protein
VVDVEQNKADEWGDERSTPKAAVATLWRQPMASIAGGAEHAGGGSPWRPCAEVDGLACFALADPRSKRKRANREVSPAVASTSLRGLSLHMLLDGEAAERLGRPFAGGPLCDQNAPIGRIRAPYSVGRLVSPRVTGGKGAAPPYLRF